MRAAIFRSAQMNTTAPPAITLRINAAATPAAIVHASQGGRPMELMKKSTMNRHISRAKPTS